MAVIAAVASFAGLSRAIDEVELECVIGVLVGALAVVGAGTVALALAPVVVREFAARSPLRPPVAPAGAMGRSPRERWVMPRRRTRAGP
ncbi:hypothetical protein [Nannocystis bainbridge]|uniref:Uncharacterized protein n=1 Tax=Nannocystis bainbridge TaxID=2995303 RepID=A0ABT5E8Z4_9BACT|nr:hypothetical protein [Nannocystis bainbridge]MDC0722337.1 hypothetical protein [Nannocystis bainbridge]